MPYKSDAQRRYFNANRAKLEAEGVDVDEWNESSKGKKLPERAKEANFIAELAKAAAAKQARCWEGYEPVPGKKPYSEDSCRPAGSGETKKKEKKAVLIPDFNSIAGLAKQAASGAWTRAEGQSESGGLNAKGRASLKAQGHDIKPPVTESKPTGERAGRKARFCARMGGMKKKLTSAETANDPDSRINKALRKWNC
jgi:hypothetical protein